MAVDARRFFVAVMHELRQRLEVSSHYDLIRAMGLARQLVLDGGRLVDHINKRHRVRLQFKLPSDKPIDRAATQVVLRGFNTASRSHTTGLSGFLGYECVSINGLVYTVADVIRIAANKEGGVHYGTDVDSHQAALINFRTQHYGLEVFGGYGPGADGIAMTAHQIVRALIEGLRPLEDAVVDELKKLDCE